jgi:acetolactate synthase small subunit
MKHFNALTEVENEVIRLAEMRKLLAVIVNGTDGSSREEIESAIHYIEGSVADISERLSDKFQQLFDAVAAEEK